MSSPFHICSCHIPSSFFHLFIECKRNTRILVMISRPFPHNVTSYITINYTLCEAIRQVHHSTPEFYQLAPDALPWLKKGEIDPEIEFEHNLRDHDLD